jgi:oxygen-independent coproporphyrinogen-3 oxidase
MGYTVRHAPALLGLGPSAIGEVGHLYAQNESDLQPWAEAIAARSFGTKRGFLLSEEDDLRRAVIRAVLCHLRVDAKATAKVFGVDFKSHFAAELLRLQEMAADRLVEIAADGSFKLTETGRYLSRNVAMVFDQYLDGPPGPEAEPTGKSKKSPRYSRTV